MKISIPDCEIVQIDKEDFDKIKNYTWRICKAKYTSYACSHFPGSSSTMLMHRLIMGFPKGIQVDHKNGDGLDNRKSNLRLCTKYENAQNRRPGRNNTSGFKGVSFIKPRGLWGAWICVNGKSINLGTFSTKESAAMAYNAKAIECFKDFAYLNKI